MHWITKSNTERDNCRWKENIYFRHFTIIYGKYKQSVTSRTKEIVLSSLVLPWEPWCKTSRNLEQSSLIDEKVEVFTESDMNSSNINEGNNRLRQEEGLEERQEVDTSPSKAIRQGCSNQIQQVLLLFNNVI